MGLSNHFFYPSHTRLASVLVCFATLLFGCGGPAHGPEFVFVDRQEIAESRAADPLALIVSVDPSGKLTLNRVDVGTIDDPQPLAQHLATIFADRKRAEINKRDVTIELNGNIQSRIFYELLARLDEADASPLMVTICCADSPK